MKGIPQRKGILQSFEAVIAILMVLTVFVVFYGPREQLPEFETINWKLKGFNALKALDRNNELRQYVLRNDTTSIKAKLSSYLPTEADYEVIVCGQTCPSVGITSEKLATVNYFIAGNATYVQPKQVVLYIW